MKLQAGLGCRIESRYENFSASVAEVSSAVSQLESVVREAEALENAANHHIRPGLQEANREANETLRQLKELSFSVQSANRIKKAYDDMEKIKFAAFQILQFISYAFSDSEPFATGCIRILWQNQCTYIRWNLRTSHL